MAFTDKNLVITPSVGSSGEDPKIVFSGADSSLGPQSLTARIYPSSNGTLSFEGSSGQLFSITNSLTGTIYSVNDASGLPSIEVFEDGVIRLARYSGRVVIGDAVDNGVDSIQFAGNTSFQFASLNANGTFTSTGQMVSLLANGTAPLVVQSSTLVANLNADLLDGQQGSYYLDWTNTTNKPDPKITVTLTGDVTGSANTTLTDLADGTISIATTVVSNAITLGTDTTGNYVATIAGTTNQVTVTGSGSESAAVTLSLPQNIHTAATPTFAGLLITAGEGLELKNGGDRTSSPTLGGWTPNDTRLINLRDSNGSTDGALLVTRDGTTAGDANVELIYIDASNFEWKGNKIWHAGNDGSGSGLDADTVDGKDIGTSGNKIPLLDGTNTWSNSQTFSAVTNFTAGGNQILLKNSVNSDPTVIHRTDGTNYYILLSDAGTTANGTWNTLRPLIINLTSGLLSSSNGQDFRGGTVFNDDSADVDFRVESNNDVNALFVDGGTDSVGIGTNTPQAKFGVSRITGHNSPNFNGVTVYVPTYTNDVVETLTATRTNQGLMSLFIDTLDTNGNFDLDVYGLQGMVQKRSAHNASGWGNTYGVRGYVEVYESNTVGYKNIDTLFGVHGAVNAGSPANNTTIERMSGVTGVASSGGATNLTVNNMRAVVADLRPMTGSSVTNAMMFYGSLGAGNPTGNITNLYGIYTEGSLNHWIRGSIKLGSAGAAPTGNTASSVTLELSEVDSATLRLTSTDTTGALDQMIGQIQFYGSDADSPGAGVKSKIASYMTPAAGDGSYLTFSTSDGATNDIERVRILSNGNVGIGTNAPSQKLDVNGVTKSNGYWIDNISYLDTATSTTTSISQIAHISFSTSSFGSGEITIQATSGVNRHLTKLLVSHDDTTAYATEYGVIKTGASLFTCDVDINSGNVRILITPASTTSTVFKSSYTLIAA